ncbi:MAG: TlpA disulfide reductase family protein [Planctomycetota bacterium]
MKIRFQFVWSLALAACLAGGVQGQEPAAESPAAEESKSEKAAEEKEEEKDPFALPEDANAEELMSFMQQAKSKRGRTMQTAMPAAKAVIAAAEALRQLEEKTDDQEMAAVREAMSAYAFVKRFEKPYQKQFDELMDSLRDDDRLPFKKIAIVSDFSKKAGTLRSGDPEKTAALVNEYKDLVREMSMDRETYGIGMTLARAMGGADDTAGEAQLYLYLAEKMAESDDENLQARAARMEGAARRVQLVGNPIEIACPTSTGEVLDWDSYRGKVVLVDFWASWCGPCRAEIPNMKRNLEAYAGKFDIVGVNLDRNIEAMNKYVEDQELTWVNLISDDEAKMGWENPMATYYGVSGIPTAILVNQKGDVVSLRARGKELDRLLEELLGPPPETEDESDDDEDDKEDDDK